MDTKRLIARLANSPMFRDYERAFGDATGMPLALRSVESWNLAHCGRRHQNAFCALIAASSPACAACLEAQQRISDSAAQQPQTTVCFAGMSEASVPVRVGGRLIGFLQTGEVIVGRSRAGRFPKVARKLREWGMKVNARSLQRAYSTSLVLTPRRFQSVLRLLAIFSDHLGLVANQIAICADHAEPASVTKARKFIRERQDEELTLADVARAVNMSTFYFCKVFKKATGLTFTEYLSRRRIEKAMKLLANPNVRVSEIAYEAGFQSLTHFNRTFHRVLGKSPTQYRAALPK